MAEGISETPQFRKRPENKVVDFAAYRDRLAAEQKPAVPGNTGRPATSETQMPTAAKQSEKVVDLEKERGNRDQEWLNGLFRARWKDDTTPLSEDIEWRLTDQEWQRVKRTDPNSYHHMRVENRIIELKKHAGGDSKLFDKLWQQELTVMQERYVQERAEEEIKARRMPSDNLTREELARRFTEAGFKPLTDQEWQKREQMKTVDPGSLSLAEWQAWRRSSASLTIENLESILEHDKLMEEYKGRERERRVALGWQGDLGDLLDGHYVNIVLECAEKAGVDPRSLTPQQRNELSIYRRFLTEEERKIPRDEFHAKFFGLDLKTFSPKAREELRTFGRFLTPDEREELTPQQPEQLPQHIVQYLEQSGMSREFSAEQFHTFQKWLWSLPLDVVIGLWAGAPEPMRQEIELSPLEEALEMVFKMIKKVAQFVIQKTCE